MIRRPIRSGYIFLISVLVIGAIASAAALSLILLGLASEQSSHVTVTAIQAMEAAQTCAERALRSLRSDVTYEGGETVALTNASCAIRRIGGYGNDGRHLCVEGASGNAVRRLEIAILRLFPTAQIDGWEEVASFSSLCPP
jgi:hypothetical protein